MKEKMGASEKAFDKFDKKDKVMDLNYSNVASTEAEISDIQFTNEADDAKQRKHSSMLDLVLLVILLVTVSLTAWMMEFQFNRTGLQIVNLKAKLVNAKYFRSKAFDGQVKSLKKKKDELGAEVITLKEQIKNKSLSEELENLMEEISEQNAKVVMSKSQVNRMKADSEAAELDAEKNQRIGFEQVLKAKSPEFDKISQKYLLERELVDMLDMNIEVIKKSRSDQPAFDEENRPALVAPYLKLKVEPVALLESDFGQDPVTKLNLKQHREAYTSQVKKFHALLNQKIAENFDNLKKGKVARLGPVAQINNRLLTNAMGLQQVYLDKARVIVQAMTNRLLAIEKFGKGAKATSEVEEMMRKVEVLNADIEVLNERVRSSRK